MGQFDTAAVALLGLMFAVFVLIALAAAFVVRLREHWIRIAVRVAASWIAASGLDARLSSSNTLTAGGSRTPRIERISACERFSGYL
jgi:hypothetical protein